MKNEKGMNFNSFIGRFRPIFAPDIPALYGQGLTDYEIVVRLWRTIVECADTINSFIELVEKLDNILTDFDTAVREEVEKVLKEMYNTGELKNILDEIANDYFKNIPKSTLDLQRQARYLKLKGDNYIWDSGTTPKPNYMQGSCFFTYNNVDYYAISYISSGVHSELKTNNGVIAIYNAANGSIAGQLPVIAGHMNSITYNNGNLFILWGYGYQNNSLVKDYRINKIPITNIIGRNMNITDYNNFTDYYTFEEKTIPFYSINEPIQMITFFDNEMFFQSNASIYKYDFETNTIIERITNPAIDNYINSVINYDNQTLSTNKDNFIWAGLAIDNNYIYYATFLTNSFILRNRKTGNIDYIYNFPQTVQNGMYHLGEIESISLLPNGDLYVFACHDIFGGTNYSQWSINEVYKTNIFTNTLTTAQRPSSLGKSGRHTIYVDRLTPCVNPNGSINKPFNLISEAIDYVNTTEWAESFEVQMLTDSNAFIYLSTQKPVKIIRASSPVNRLNFNQSVYGQASVGGIVINGASNIVLEHLEVHFTLPPEYFSVDYLGYVNIINGASVSCNDLFIAPVDTDNRPKAYFITESFVNITGGDRTTVGTTEFYSGILWSQTYIHAIASTINAHKRANTDPNVIA